MSDVDGVTDFWTKGRLSSVSRLSEFPKSRKIEVQNVRLYSIDLNDVSAIKIDVEGFEATVLRGARTILERDKPAIILEALDGIEAIADELKGVGYFLHTSLDRWNFLFKSSPP